MKQTDVSTQGSHRLLGLDIQENMTNTPQTFLSSLSSSWQQKAVLKPNFCFHFLLCFKGLGKKASNPAAPQPSSNWTERCTPPVLLLKVKNNGFILEIRDLGCNIPHFFRAEELSWVCLLCTVLPVRRRVKMSLVLLCCTAVIGAQLTLSPLIFVEQIFLAFLYTRCCYLSMAVWLIHFKPYIIFKWLLK